MPGSIDSDSARMCNVVLPEASDNRSLSLATARAGEYLLAAQADNTRRAYRCDWRDFSGFCRAAGLDNLPASPETVAVYLSSLAETAGTATLARRLAAISQAHQAAGLESPTLHLAVRKVMAGIRRRKGSAPVRKRPLVTADVRALVAPLGRSPLEVRDRALVLLGFAGAFRRSELVALDVDDLEFHRDGVVAAVRRSKTDPEGKGRRVGIPYGSTPATCPVRALEAWRGLLGGGQGPLFRAVHRNGSIASARLTAQSVALILKRLAASAGMDPAQVAGHSLRAGLATAAAAAGVSERAIMQQTGHRSAATLRQYIRHGSLFLENAAAKVGL